MEPAGVFLGVVGLAGLFNTCLQLFDTISSGKTHGAAYQSLMCKLEVEQVLLMRWGEAVGIFSIEGSRCGAGRQYDERLNNNLIQSVVIKTLSCLKTTFENTSDLVTRYGLQPHTTDDTSVSQVGYKPTFKSAHSKLQLLAKRMQDEASFSQKTRWAIHDRSKFELLIAEIRGFNESLSRLLPDVGQIQQQRAQAEIAKSDDMEALQILAEAAKGTHNLISDAASIRISDLSQSGTTDNVVDWLERTNTQGLTNKTQRVRRVLARISEKSTSVRLRAPRRLSSRSITPPSPAQFLKEPFTSQTPMAAKRSPTGLTNYFSPPINKQDHGGSHTHWENPFPYPASHRPSFMQLYPDIPATEQVHQQQYSYERSSCSGGDMLPLMLRAIMNEDTPEIRRLLENGCGINARDSIDGSTPLLYAVRYRRVELIKTLLHFGSDLNTADFQGRTSIIIAIINQDITMLKRLVQLGAGVNIATSTFAHTPLCYAVLQGYQDFVEELVLNLGADINAEDYHGCTPLLYATRYYNPECIRHLVQLGADVNAPRGTSRTPLLEATKNNSQEAVKQLLALGADGSTLITADNVPPQAQISEMANLVTEDQTDLKSTETVAPGAIKAGDVG